MQRWGVWVSAGVCASMLFVGQQSGAQAMDAASPLSLPHDPISFQQGPGSNIASSYCLICHSAEYVYTQPPHSQERWMEIIKKMKHTFGCPIPDEQISPLAQYLFVQNTVQPFPAVKKMKLQLQCPMKIVGILSVVRRSIAHTASTVMAELEKETDQSASRWFRQQQILQRLTRNQTRTYSKLLEMAVLERQCHL